MPGQWRGQKALFGISQNVAERKRLEAALRESEEKYQALLKRFESQPGKGTSFKISPPRFEGRSIPLPIAKPRPVRRKSTETILLAEDEPSLRRLIARVLRTQGYTVLEAADGNEALALAQANGVKIQLLITDVIMPGLSSKMLAEWLKQVNPGVRVLFISGYINNNAVRDAMSKPGMFFLQKPFNPRIWPKRCAKPSKRRCREVPGWSVGRPTSSFELLANVSTLDVSFKFSLCLRRKPLKGRGEKQTHDDPATPGHRPQTRHAGRGH